MPRPLTSSTSPPGRPVIQIVVTGSAFRGMRRSAPSSTRTGERLHRLVPQRGLDGGGPGGSLLLGERRRPAGWVSGSSRMAVRPDLGGDAGRVGRTGRRDGDPGAAQHSWEPLRSRWRTGRPDERRSLEHSGAQSEAFTEEQTQRARALRVAREVVEEDQLTRPLTAAGRSANVAWLIEVAEWIVWRKVSTDAVDPD